MKPGICEKHGIHNFILTSSDFSSAIDEGKTLDSSDAYKIRTNSLEKINETIVNENFFRRFFEESEGLEVLLVDRERSLKKMNDRLLIIKIFSDPELRYVCPVCLNQLFE